jgi:FlaA1/EpsC-like NDP-sugar epimerase
VEIWWSRNGAKADETLIIRHEYEDRQQYENRSTADVLELTFGQVYDLIDGLNKAVESK